MYILCSNQLTDTIYICVLKDVDNELVVPALSTVKHGKKRTSYSIPVLCYGSMNQTFVWLISNLLSFEPVISGSGVFLQPFRLAFG